MAFGPPHGELLQVIVRDVLERGERVPAVLVEGGSVRGQLVLGEEGGDGLRHLWAADGRESFRRANLLYSLLYSLLYIPLYRKLLYKAKNRCIRRYHALRHGPP